MGGWWVYYDDGVWADGGGMLMVWYGRMVGFCILMDEDEILIVFFVQ